MAATAFLRNLIAAVPYWIHIVLTDNGIQSTNREGHLHALEHIFDRVCGERQIDHRYIKIKHPWRNEDQKTIGRLVFPSGGQVERVNRTIKEAIVKRFHYDDHEQFRANLANFLTACSFGRRLKTLKGLTPYEFICKQSATEPEWFTLNSIRQMPRLNT